MQLDLMLTLPWMITFAEGRKARLIQDHRAGADFKPHHAAKSLAQYKYDRYPYKNLSMLDILARYSEDGY